MFAGILSTFVNGPWKQVAWDSPSHFKPTQRDQEKNISGSVSSGGQCYSLKKRYSQFVFCVSGHSHTLLSHCLPMQPVNVQSLNGGSVMVTLRTESPTTGGNRRSLGQTHSGRIWDKWILVCCSSLLNILTSALVRWVSISGLMIETDDLLIVPVVGMLFPRLPTRSLETDR